jgi:hypothetical protein
MMSLRNTHTSARQPQTAALLLVLSIVFAVASQAQVQGLGYRLSPAGGYALFDDDAGLTDGILYGGSAGLSFGEFVELAALYEVSTDIETQFASFDADAEPAVLAGLRELTAREVGVERLGGQLKLNLATGPIVPFLLGGGGVVRFTPEGQSASRTLFLAGGGGLQLAASDRLSLALSAENMAYRYSPGTAFFAPDELATVGLAPGDLGSVEVRNWLLRGALQLYLGGRRPGELSDLDRDLRRSLGGGLSGLSVQVEPAYGRVSFGDDLGYADQSFVGAEAGLDFGPLVGLRASYARGVDAGDPTDFQPIQMLGGAARFRLNEGAGAVPFLSLGGGLLSVLDGYASLGTDSTTAAEDRPYAHAGAGIELPLGRRLALLAEARALLMSAGDAADVSQPDDILISPFYRAGVSLAVGGSAGRRPDVVRRATLEDERARLRAEIAAEQDRAAEAETRAARREAELDEALAEARAQGDSLEIDRVERLRAEAAAATDQATLDRAAIDRVAARTDRAPLDTARVEIEEQIVQFDRQPSSNLSGQTITLPVPAVGELYVRYGEPGGVLIENLVDGRGAAMSQAAPADLRALVREALAEALEETAPDQPLDEAALMRRIEDRLADRVERAAESGASADDLARMERRLTDRLDDQIRQLRLQMAMQAQPAPPVSVMLPGASDSTRVAAGLTPATPTASTTLLALPRGPVAFVPTLGIGFGSGVDNTLVGAQVRLNSGGALTLAPEILVGVTGRRAFLGNADVLLGLSAASLATTAAPYFRAGIGVLHAPGEEATDTVEGVEDKTALTLNLGVGADMAAGSGRFVIDFASGNFGAYNRFTVGYRLTFGSSN